MIVRPDFFAARPPGKRELPFPRGPYAVTTSSSVFWGWFRPICFKNNFKSILIMFNNECEEVGVIILKLIKILMLGVS